MAATDFAVKLDTKDFLRSKQQIIAGFSDIDKSAQNAGSSLGGMGKKIAGAAAAYFSIQQAQQFLNKVIEIRGQFQKLDIAFTTMLQGNREASSKLMNELTEFASVTPFGLMDAASGAKQLLAYGFDVKNVVKDMEMLGNVASGVSAPLNDIVYLYGTLKASGRVMTMDIRQFAGRGIPIYRELASVLGVAESEINDLVSAGKVGFKDIEKAFQRMTGQGGTFYNLMREQSKSLPGQISNLEDSIDMMFNEIGAASQEFISKGIEGVAWLVENYEKVGRTLLELVATYGAYKVALVAVKAAKSGMTLAEIGHRAAIVATEKAQKALNATMLKNPYVLAAAGIAALGYGMYKLITYQTDYQESVEELNGSFAKSQAEAAKEIAELDRLKGKLKGCEEETDAYKKTKQEIVSKFGKYDETLKAETLSVQTLTDKYKSLTDAIVASANQRMYNDWKAKATERYNTKEAGLLDEIYKELSESYGHQKASEWHQQILSAVYKGYNPADKKQGYTEIWRALQKTSMLGEVNDLAMLFQNQQKILAQAKQRFNIKDEVSTTTEDGTEEEEKKIKEQTSTIQQAREKYNASLIQQSREAKLAQKQAEIDGMREGFAREMAEIDLEYQQRQDKVKEYEERWLEELRDYKQAEWKEANPDAKDKSFDRSSITASDLTTEQKNYLASYQEQADEYKKNATAQLLKSEFSAMQESLKNYGTFQERKLAIATLYGEKIANAQTETERRKLTQQRDSELANIEAEALKANINWEVVFGELGGMFESVVRPVLNDARKYLETDAFKNADQDSQQALIDAIHQMEENLGGVGNVSFKSLGKDVKNYQTALKKLQDSQDEYERAYQELIAAQNTYTLAIKNGTEQEQQSAQEELINAQNREKAAAENVQATENAAKNAQTTMAQNATTLSSSLNDVVGGLQKLSSGSLSGAYEGLKNFAKGIGDLNLGKVSDAFGNLAKGMQGTGLIGAIFAILDLLREGIGKFISNILDAVFDIVHAILSDIFNLRDGLFRQLGESLYKGILGIFTELLTLGGWFDWIKEESDPNLKRDTEMLTASNDALRRSIDNLSEKMEDASAVDAKEMRDKQIALNKQSEANTRDMMFRAGAAYSRGFLGIGGTHSSNKRINDAITGAEWGRINESLKRNDIYDASAFWNLSSKQMRQVALELPDIYARIKAYADDGYENAAQYMDSYIEFAKEREEIEREYKETLTGVSFQEWRDEFKSILTDMEMDAEEFSENFNAKIVDSIADSIMKDKYNERLEGLYNAWGDALIDDNNISDEEWKRLQAVKETLYRDMEKDRENLKQLVGYEEENERQSASRGIATASQESVDENNARLTTIQAHTASIAGNVEEMTKEIREQRLTALRTAEITDDIRANTVQIIQHLQGIETNTAKLDKIDKTLSDIALKGIKMK